MSNHTSVNGCTAQRKLKWCNFPPSKVHVLHFYTMVDCTFTLVYSGNDHKWEYEYNINQSSDRFSRKLPIVPV